jgi:uncharacterized protein (DUF885 family)
MRAILFLCSILLALQLSAQGQQRIVLDKVIADVEAFFQNEFPPDTVTVKNPFGSYSDADLLRRYTFSKEQLQQLNNIDATKLPLNDRIDLELMKYRLQEQLNYYEFKEYMNPVLSDNGFHTDLPFEASRQYTTVSELKRYISRLKAFPAYASEQMNWIRKGLALGISQPRVALAGYESTYNTHITDSVEHSVFFQPFRRKPAAISEQQWKNLVAEGKETILNAVIPAYRNIRDFFEKEYYPKARTTLGASAMPNGKAYYEALVKHHTTTDLTPDSVYNIGMKEVERIKKEMEAVMKEVNFAGSFNEFLVFLRTDPKFYATSPEQLLKEASYIAKKIDGKLPSLFGKLPRQPYGVLPVPDYLAPSYTTGRYAGAPITSKNSGSYWVNTFNLKSRTLYTLEALTLHEAVPGHHLQTALAQELTNLPRFRQNMYVNAFGEGWGLYSEYLGTELGLYKDPYSRFGRLTYEMWRACRLVIDVGIHAKGWTREQAVQFLASNSALSYHEVNTEVNRYITWPGQALAYKIGELKIIALRRKAEQALGEKFDIRAFHDLVLSQGSVTLSILEMMVNDWIGKELKK